MPVVADSSLLAFPCDFPIKVMGRKRAGFAHAVTDIVRQARAGLRRRHGRDAAEPPGQVPQRHLRRARHLARAARRAVPGAVRPSDGGDGALTLVERHRRQAARPRRLRADAGGDARVHARRATDDTADELWLVRASAGLHRWGRAPSTCCGANASRSCRPTAAATGHLSRPRPGGGLYAGRPARGAASR